MSSDEDHTEEGNETNQRVTFEFDELYPEELKPHPVNITLYGEEEPDETLINSILDKGLVEPLIINKENLIISGHRRWLALKYIDEHKLPDKKIDDKTGLPNTLTYVRRKVKCDVATFRDENEEKKAIVEYNRRRKKRYSQLYNEIELLHEIYDPEATQTRLRNLKQNSDPLILASRIRKAIECGEIDPQEIDSSIKDSDLGSTYKELALQLIEKDNKDDPDPKNLETRKRIADTLDIGKSNVGKLTNIGRYVKYYGDEDAKQIMKKLDSGKLTINGADIIVKLKKIYKSGVQNIGDNGFNAKGVRYSRDLLEEINNGDKTPKKAWEEYLEVVPQKNNKVNSTGKQRVYSIILINPELSFEAIKNKDIPAAKDAALFLIADQKNVKHFITMIRLWNFEFESFAFVAEDSRYRMLLFSIKGDFSLPSESKLFSSGAIQSREEIYKAIKEMYPDVISLYEIGVENQRNGWGMQYVPPKPEGARFEPENDPEGELKDDGIKDDDKSFKSPASLGRW